MTARRSKRAGEAITYRFKFARALETLWEPGTEYQTGEYVRPLRPNGYEYECTTAGQSAQDEPDWSESVSGTTSDGSVTWTTRAMAGNARDAINAVNVTPDAGITYVGFTIDGDDILVKLSGGTVGQCYDIECEVVTVAGEEYSELLVLTVT